MKKLKLHLCFLLLSVFFLPIMGQREMEYLDRGIIAMPKSASQIFVSWRHLATDSDSIAYNLYYKTSEAGSLSLLNSIPITNSTNYLASLSTATSAYTFVVKSVLNGEERNEAGSFTLPQNSVPCRIVRDFDFAPLPNGRKMFTKFIWPADLDGDGKYDFVMDRLASVSENEDSEEDDSSGESSKLEAYTSDGEFLWRIDMGNNIVLSSGHSDKVTAYDMDGDGKAEVLLMVSEGTTFADGTVVTGVNGQVTDYSNLAGSAPQWLSIVNGETGVEIDRIPLPLQNELATTRSDKWKDFSGHFVIAYLDGIHPSLIYQYKNRAANDNFQGAHAAWRFVNGELELQWTERTRGDGAEFHQVRVADIDGDGRDNFVEGGYALDYDGSYMYTSTGVTHGDRHVLADIDPDRPGLEHFFIQQVNPSLLGSGILDAGTGELIKGLYLGALYDVGRGTCGAYDPTSRGLQFWSNMNEYAMYNNKGNTTGGTGLFAAETFWWGGDLAARHISYTGNDKNPKIDKYNTSTNSIGRETNLYNEENGNGRYYFTGPNGGRAAFWGDLFGDWREELIYCKKDSSGWVILSTWDETSHRQYTLMQNPAYRGQTTARGYYQTANVDFYMAADMPNPPIPPVQKANLYYTGIGWINNQEIDTTYQNGKSIMFDIRGGNNTFALDNVMSPSRVWLMNPKGSDYTFSGEGKFTGSMDLVKSLQGSATFNGNHDYTGVTRISEGKLIVNGSLASKVQLDARGVIAGNAVLNGGIELESGLNVFGGRIEPGNDSLLGRIVINGDLSLKGRNNLAFDINANNPLVNDSLKINGNFTAIGSNNSIVITYTHNLDTGVYTLVTCTGTLNATIDNFKVVGLEGIPYELIIQNGSISIGINEAREAGNVTWTGAISDIWDFTTTNFLHEGNEEKFVPGDVVTFDDSSIVKTVNINETMPVNGLIFNNDTAYTLVGTGIISGSGGLTKTGIGTLTLSTVNNSFTGPVVVENGIIAVSSLSNGGIASSIGASSANASNWIMKNATLQTTAQLATDRSMQIEGKLTVNNPNNDNSVMISGNIGGSDAELEVTGSGSLILQGENTFDKVTVKSGFLILGGSEAANRLALGTADVFLEGGTFTMFNVNSTQTIGPFTNRIIVPEGKSATWNLPSRWRFENKLTGNGTITVNVPYVRNDFYGDWSEFAGVIKFTGRDIRLNNAVARNIPNAEVNLGTGTSLYVSSGGQATFTLGALSGLGGIDGANNIIVGNRNDNTVFEGVISAGSGKLTKTGTGILTLSGNNLYTGGTSIDGGEIVAANNVSTLGTGYVIVNGTATLRGNGMVKGAVLVKSGATLAAGLTTEIGTLNMGSNVELSTGAKTLVKIENTAAYDKFIISGNLTLKGTLEFDNINGITIAEGTDFLIFNVAGNITGDIDEIVPSTPGEGLLWDTSRLTTEGIISVKQNSQNNVNNLQMGDIQLAPTLVDAACVIKFNSATVRSTEIELLNQIGVVMEKHPVRANATSYSLDLSNYSTGLYYIRVTKDGIVSTHKIIKK